MDLDINKVYEICQEFSRYLTKKTILYQFFSSDQKLFLPDIYSIDIKFLVDVLAGDKKVITKEQAESVKVAQNLGVSRENLYSYCKEHSVIRDYIPSDKPTDRDYLVKMIGFFDKDKYDKLLDESTAKKEKQYKDRIFNEQESIKVCGEFAKILLMLPVLDPAGTKLPSISSSGKKRGRPKGSVNKNSKRSLQAFSSDANTESPVKKRKLENGKDEEIYLPEEQ